MPFDHDPDSAAFDWQSVDPWNEIYDAIFERYLATGSDASNFSGPGGIYMRPIAPYIGMPSPYRPPFGAERWSDLQTTVLHDDEGDGHPGGIKALFIMLESIARSYTISPHLTTNPNDSSVWRQRYADVYPVDSDALVAIRSGFGWSADGPKRWNGPDILWDGGADPANMEFGYPRGLGEAAPGDQPDVIGPWLMRELQLALGSSVFMSGKTTNGDHLSTLNQITSNISGFGAMGEVHGAWVNPLGIGGTVTFVARFNGRNEPTTVRPGSPQTVAPGDSVYLTATIPDGYTVDDIVLIVSDGTSEYETDAIGITQSGSTVTVFWPNGTGLTVQTQIQWTQTANGGTLYHRWSEVGSSTVGPQSTATLSAVTIPDGEWVDALNVMIQWNFTKP